MTLEEIDRLLKEVYTPPVVRRIMAGSRSTISLNRLLRKLAKSKARGMGLQARHGAPPRWLR
jgi:hypothetical protein